MNYVHLFHYLDEIALGPAVHLEEVVLGSDHVVVVRVKDLHQ